MFWSRTDVKILKRCTNRVYKVWEEASAIVEITQGKTIADASVKAGVTQLIWSSLPSVTLMTKGKVTGVEHFDSKAEVETYIRGLNIKSLFFMAGWYMQNQLSIFRPKPVFWPVRLLLRLSTDSH